MQTPKAQPRVLVIRGGAIGDFVLTLPAIRLLRETIAGCHLEVLGYPGIMDLALKAGLADATRSLEHRSMALLFAKDATIDPALVEYLCGFSLVVSYLFDPDGILRANLERIGVKTLLECPHRVRPGQGHAAEQLAKPLERLAMFLEEPEWRRPLFTPLSLSGEKARRVAIHLGSGSASKNWPVAQWHRLIEEIHLVFPHWKIALVTGEAEEERGACAVMPAVPHEHWRGLPLTTLTDRLAACDLFLGHDSGISHLASACGVACLLLFGPTDPAVWAPPQPGVQVLRACGGVLAELDEALVREVVMHRLHALDVNKN